MPTSAGMNSDTIPFVAKNHFIWLPSPTPARYLPMEMR